MDLLRSVRVSRPCFLPWKNFRSLKAGDSSSQARRIARSIPDFGILTFAFWILTLPCVLPSSLLPPTKLVFLRLMRAPRTLKSERRRRIDMTQACKISPRTEHAFKRILDFSLLSIRTSVWLTWLTVSWIFSSTPSSSPPKKHPTIASSPTPSHFLFLRPLLRTSLLPSHLIPIRFIWRLSKG